MVAGRSWLFPFEFGRERSAPHPGAVGLGDAQHVVQHARADTRAGGRIASHAIARGDKGIGAVVDIKQGTLRTFKQQVGASLVGFIELARDIGHHRGKGRSVGHGLVVERVEVQRCCMQMIDEHIVVQRQVVSQLGSKTLRISEVLHAQGPSRDLVFVSRADAATGGADFFAARLGPGRFAGHIERDMVGQDQRARFGHTQPGTHFDTSLFQSGDFLKKFGYREDHAIADVTLDPRAHDAARNQVQGGFHPIDHQGVASVVATLKTNHSLCRLGQPVDEFAFALVAPLRADDDHIAALGCVHAVLLWIRWPGSPTARRPRSVRGRNGIRRFHFRGRAGRTPRSHLALAGR